MTIDAAEERRLATGARALDEDELGRLEEMIRDLVVFTRTATPQVVAKDIITTTIIINDNKHDSGGGIVMVIALTGRHFTNWNFANHGGSMHFTMAAVTKHGRSWSRGRLHSNSQSNAGD